eukprot:GHVU01042121.1.p1 GENE.GHVU01042121.1~~GHVU01042121.1.p1  ORF type:complete len:280 (-),score=70.15 GHVU01042121.1:97-843(-)
MTSPTPHHMQQQQQQQQSQQLGVGSSSGIGEEQNNSNSAHPSPPPPSSSSSNPHHHQHAGPVSICRSPNRQQQLSLNFLRTLESLQCFEVAPLYVLLHEAIYCDGGETASRWSAHRVMQRFPEYDWSRQLEAHKHINFTGEAVFPWMMEDYHHLSPLARLAEAVATKTDWETLYDVPALRRCSSVPVVAVVYYDDIHVERSFSEHTAHMIPSCKLWITNEYQHSGLRDDGYAIMSKLLCMLRGHTGLP